jgi:DNA-binding PadR family transcriptional regulator
MIRADIAILALLKNEPRHGYFIKKAAEYILGENLALNDNTLYSTLHRFEAIGAVKSKAQHVTGKPDRRVYSITDKGQTLLKELILNFPPELADNGSEFYVRVAFFFVLEPEERTIILQARHAALLRHVARLQRMEKARPQYSAGLQGYDKTVLQFRAQQIRNEIDWISQLEMKIEEPPRR